MARGAPKDPQLPRHLQEAADAVDASPHELRVHLVDARDVHEADGAAPSRAGQAQQGGQQAEGHRPRA